MDLNISLEKSFDTWSNGNNWYIWIYCISKIKWMREKKHSWKVTFFGHWICNCKYFYATFLSTIIPFKVLFNHNFSSTRARITACKWLSSAANGPMLLNIYMSTVQPNIDWIYMRNECFFCLQCIIAWRGKTMATGFPPGLENREKSGILFLG